MKEYYVNYISVRDLSSNVLITYGTELYLDDPILKKYNLQPYDKVLVRYRKDDEWTIDFFKYYDKK